MGGYIRCRRGHQAIFLDLGKWVGEILSTDNKRQLWIPPGFAHGFYALSEWANVIYKATNYYYPELGPYHILE